MVSSSRVARWQICGAGGRANARAGFDVRERGLTDAPGLTVYASTETHSSVRKAVELLGLGHEALRSIPVSADYAIDLQALRETIAADKRAGRRPICVVGNAGTVNTGATDDLRTLAALCRDEGLWFHVDGHSVRSRRSCRSSSLSWRASTRPIPVAFDLHKWMYMPYEVGCTLVRDQKAHRADVQRDASLSGVIRSRHRGGRLSVRRAWLQLSRGFRALKVWMSFKTHGLDAFAQLIHQNVRQAHLSRGTRHQAPAARAAGAGAAQRRLLPICRTRSG